MKNWQLFISVFASCILIARPTEISIACGFDPDEFIESLSFFDPVLTQQADFSPLFLSMDRFYDYSWDTDSAKHTDNLQEWQAYHKGKPSLEDLSEIVYRVPAGPLEDMKEWLEGKNGTAPADSLQQNAVVAFWKKNRWSMPACYLDFAKRCQPHVSGDYNPWEDIERDTAAMNTLISEGIEKYTMTDKDPFLQLRYAYQVVRLAHYSDQFQEAINLFEELVSPVKDKADSQFYYWTLAHKAGAMRSLGQEIEAAYLFSQVFDACPAKRIPAWLSFRVADDAAWTQLMATCQTDAEKANLFFMRAIDPEAQVIDEMQAIYAIDPASPKLNMLLAREINKLEYDLFGWNFDYEFPLKTEYNGTSMKRALAYRGEVEVFVKQCRQDKKVLNPEFWQLAEGYLALMDSRFDAAATTFASVARQSKDAREQRYAKLFQWVCQIAQLQALPEATEDRLYKQLESFDFGQEHQIREKAERFLLNRFQVLYETSGQAGKAFLCRFGIYDLRIHARPTVVNSLIDWYPEAKANPTSLETFFISKLEQDNVPAMTALQELKATFLLREGDWEDALAIYERLEMEDLKKITYFRIPEDPFEPLTWDCFGCFEEGYHEAGPMHYQYNRLTFARKMIELEMGIEQDESKQAENSFLLGTAIYNSSDFGVTWMVGDYFRGGYESHNDSSYAEIQRDAMGRALAHFDAVISSTGDLELAAQAHFHAAKCEQALFYLDGYSDWESKDINIKVDSYREHFGILHENFKNTQYYQEVLRECTYLQTYSYMME